MNELEPKILTTKLFETSHRDLLCFLTEVTQLKSAPTVSIGDLGFDRA